MFIGSCCNSFADWGDSDTATLYTQTTKHQFNLEYWLSHYYPRGLELMYWTSSIPTNWIKGNLSREPTIKYSILFNLKFFDPNFFDQKIVLTQNFLDLKCFGTKNIWVQKNFGPKEFWVNIFLNQQILFGKRLFLNKLF